MKSISFFGCIFFTFKLGKSCVVYYKWNQHELQEICKPVQKSDDLSTNADRSSSFVSVSQCEQDKLVLKLLESKRNGFFVDLAANDYIKLSNSYSIERYYNWSGICIEPNPEYLDGILSHRKCKLVINPIYSGMNETVKFRFRGHESGIIGDEMDNKDKEPADVEMYTVTLTKVLKQFNAPHIIDYFSLDVEGGEYSVLKNFFDFQNDHHYIFLVLTIERPTERLHSLLLKHHYVFLTSLRQVMYDKSYYGECIYVHRTIPKLQKIFHEFRNVNINTAWRNTSTNAMENHPYLLRVASISEGGAAAIFRVQADMSKIIPTISWRDSGASPVRDYLQV